MNINVMPFYRHFNVRVYKLKNRAGFQLLFSLIFMLVAISGMGQTPLLTENFGTTVGTFPTGWTSSNTTNGFGAVTTSASTGYAGSSGSINARLANTGTNGVAHTLTYSNSLSTVGFTSVTVLWGARATGTFTQPVTFQWSSDGTIWNTVTYTQVTNNATWALVNAGTRIALPAGAGGIANLRFRWSVTSNNSGNYQVDDFSVSAAPASPPSITSSLSASGTVGTAFTYNITAINSPSSYDATGLPAGLTRNTTSGLISGTPTTAGNSNISISATNASGTDTKTLVLTVGPGSQVITFNALAAKTYGDIPFTLNGTSSSGLGLSYASSDPLVATISGNTVTIVGAGTTNITASQGGDANWNAATDVVRSLTVNKANQSITFSALADKNDTDGPFALTATASSGLAVSYQSLNTSVITISGSTATIAGAGDALIEASQPGDNNYNAATTVTQNQHVINTALQNQTITFNALTAATYGDAPYQLTATASSGLTVSYQSSNTSVATVSGDMITIIAPGTTNITASQPGNGSYNPAPGVAQSLTVNAKTITVSGVVANNKVYDGNTSATLDLTGVVLNGIVGTDVVTVSGTGVFTDANAGTLKAVTTTLILGGADASKYLITQPAITANITQASQTITFNALPYKNVTDIPFTLNGTTSSALTVSYTSSNPAVATISGNTVTITGAGTTIITASQAGDQNYAVASNVLQTLTVNNIVTWNFGTVSPGSAAPSGIIPAGVTISNVTRGNNNGITTLLSVTSASSGYTGASGSFNAASAIRNNGFDKDTSTYIEFTLTPGLQKRVILNSVAFGSRSTNTGPQAYSFRNSLTGYTTDMASGTTLNNSVWALRTPVTTAITSAYSLPVTYRLYAYNSGAVSSYLSGTANWRIDDLALSLFVEDAPPCTGTPASGTAIAAGNNFCGNGSTTVSLSGNTDPNNETGLALQWYSSTDNVNFIPAGTANSASLETGTISQTQYYYATISCSLSGLSSVSNTITVTVNPLPSVSISGLSGSYCINAAPVTLTGNHAPAGTFGGPGITDNNDGTATFDPSAAGAGSYTITYTFNEGTCDNTASVPVTISDLPVVTYTGLASMYCANAAIVLLTGNHAPAGTFSGAGIVDNGDGTANFNASVAGAGTHTITYAYTDVTTGCGASSSQSVTINAVPVVSFTGLSASYCSNAIAVTLNGMPSGGTFNGPGITGNTFDPSAAGAGIHSIVYSYTDVTTGCIGTTTQSVTVNAVPTVSFTGLASDYCAGAATVTLNGIPSGGTFSGAGITGNNFDPATTGVGTFTVTYTYADVNGCSGASSQSVTVNPTPVVSFTGLPANMCSNATAVTLNGTPTGGTFSGAGITGNSFDPATAGVGPHVITYTYSDGTCTGTSTQTVTVTAPQAASFTGLVGPYCTTDGAVTLVGSPLGGTFTGPGITGNSFSPSAAGVGTHTITYTYTNGGCINTTTQNVTVNNCTPPTITLNVKAYMEGFYDVTTSLMRTTLFDLGISTISNETDTVIVNLWSAASLSNPEPDYTQKVVVHADGMMTATFPGALSGQSFYIALKHKNTIETWSASPVEMSPITSYDFTDNINKAYGDGVNPPMRLLAPGVYGCYGGDVNQDGGIDSGDMTEIDNDASVFAFGYIISDCTGDGGADSNDMQIVDNNAQLFLFYARPF